MLEKSSKHGKGKPIKGNLDTQIFSLCKSRELKKNYLSYAILFFFAKNVVFTTQTHDFLITKKIKSSTVY